MFLGTSSAVPRPGYRNVSSMLLQFASGSMAVIDCGEATQHQLMRSSVKMGQIDNILLTHLHGDHCYGFFGLVHTMNSGGRLKPVNVYGPKGVDELVRTVLRLTGGWDAFELNITELEPEQMHNFELRCASNTLLANITACPMVHRTPAFGYVFRELDPPRTLDVEAARNQGVPMVDFRRLKDGEDVTLADGRTVAASTVTLPARPARTIAVLQDTSDASSALPYMADCDLMIHEATYERSLREQAVKYGHSTSEMAAECAKQVHAKNLVLTHFSSRYSDDAKVAVLRTDAEEVLAGTDTNVVLAEDFMCFSGPDFGTITSIAKPI
jgi:ribonuclease Z